MKVVKLAIIVVLLITFVPQVAAVVPDVPYVPFVCADGRPAVQEASYAQQVAQHGVPRLAQTAGNFVHTATSAPPNVQTISRVVSDGVVNIGTQLGTTIAAFRTAARGQASILAPVAPPTPASSTMQAASCNGAPTDGRRTDVTPAGLDAWQGRYANGRIPESALDIPKTAPTHRLHPDAAKAYDALNAAYTAHFGKPIGITDSYRSLAGQHRVAADKPGLAATPGTSNHGWGLAVDLSGGINDFGTPQHEWMRANAPRFGWDNPPWARQGGSKPEAWHWEFTLTKAGTA